RRGPIEVGRSASRRTAFELKPTQIQSPGRSPLAFQTGDVVVISGGARGVTAEVAVALAAAWRPTIVLLGRSPEPAQEPDWLARLHIETDVKRAIATRANGHSSPKVVAEEFDRISANREIVRNIERIEQAGARVVYRSVDVRDAGAV